MSVPRSVQLARLLAAIAVVVAGAIGGATLVANSDVAGAAPASAAGEVIVPTTTSPPVLTRVTPPPPRRTTTTTAAATTPPTRVPPTTSTTASTTPPPAPPASPAPQQSPQTAGDQQCVPDALDDYYTTAKDTQLVVGGNADVGVNDVLCGGNWTIVGAAPATHGTVWITPNADGEFTYDPDPGFVGTDSFTYALLESGNEVDQATCT